VAAPDSAPRPSRRPARLAPVEVHADIAPSAEPEVGSGVPARISVITGRQIDSWEPRLLADALGTRAGVSLYDDLGTPWKLTLGSRGFAVGPTVGLPPGITVFLDGVRQNEPDAQEVDFDLLPLEHVARVELLSGSASLLGPNSLGGAINLVTERGEGAPSGSLELSTSSLGGVGGDATLAGETPHGVDYYAGTSCEHERGWRVQTGATTCDALVTIGRRGERRGIVMRTNAARSRARSAGSLPESLFDVAPRTNFTPGDVDDLGVAQIALSGYAPLGAGRAQATAYVRGARAERFNVNQAPDPNVRSRTANFTAGLTADVRRSLALRSGVLAARLGLDAAVSRVRIRLFNEPADPAGGASTLTTDARSPGVDAAAYALLDYRVRSVTLSGGTRYDVVRVPFRNALRAEDRTTNTYHTLSPRIGVSVAVADGASLYASAGRSFRAPAILELACADPSATCPLPFALGDDPPLAPVRATTYESGARLARGAVLVALSAYRTEVRDEIFFVTSPGALLSGYFTNVARTRREGLEASVEGTQADSRLAWYANYAFTRATFRSPATVYSIRSDADFADSPLAGSDAVSAGDRLPLVPEHQVKAGVNVELRRGLGAGVDVRYTGQQRLRGDETNETRPLAPYALVGARLGADHGRWHVGAIVTNLFDSRRATFGTFNENRETGALERFLTPLGPRTVKLVLRRRFGAGEDDDS
jgi:outer membrane receptor protein involved in Fe transport